MIISNLNSTNVNVDHWEIGPGQSWVVLGRNGSGKRELAEALLAHNEASRTPLRAALLSFEEEQAFYERELERDDSDFLDHPDPGTTVRELLEITGGLPAQLEFLGLGEVLDRGYRQLSSGEARKALLARALLQQPDLLILDEPYDALDQHSRRELTYFLGKLQATEDMRLVLLLGSLSDIAPWHSHIAVLEKGELIAQGPRERILNDVAIKALLDFNPNSLPPWPAPLSDDPVPDPVVKLVNGKVAYHDKLVFQGLNLTVRPGEHTLITGPNGSGKSTLLAMITGDHPQSYGNDLSVLGFRRGSGESIWDLKARIGIVSPELHRSHRSPGSALEVTLSGFFDSIGLYDHTSPDQVTRALRWLDLTGMRGAASRPFKQLSYGEQRLVLIARALVKEPALLICDEPTQGLDDVNRHRFIYFLEHLITQRRSTILMASHRQDEALPLFRQHLELQAGAAL